MLVMSPLFEFALGLSTIIVSGVVPVMLAVLVYQSFFE